MLGYDDACIRVQRISRHRPWTKTPNLPDPTALQF
jgi:hypothetical protein